MKLIPHHQDDRHGADGDGVLVTVRRGKNQMVAAVCGGVTAAPSGACGPRLPRRRRDASATGEPAARAAGVAAATLERDRLDAAILRGRGQSAMGDAPSAPGRRTVPDPATPALARASCAARAPAPRAPALQLGWRQSSVILGFEDDGGLIAAEPRVEHRHAREAVLRAGASFISRCMVPVRFGGKQDVAEPAAFRVQGHDDDGFAAAEGGLAPLGCGGSGSRAPRPR